MIQEENINENPQQQLLSLQSNNGSFTHFHIEKGVLYTLSQKDILYSNSPQFLSSLDKVKEKTPRFFIEKEKTQIIENKRLEPTIVPLWIHLSLLLGVIVILFARHSFTRRSIQIIQSTFNPQQVKQLLREGNLLKQRIPILLLLLYTFTISLFVFLATSINYTKSLNFSFGQGFLLLFGAVILYHGLKFVIILFLGLLFDTPQISLRYLLDHYLFYITEGFILFPLLILYVYSGLQIFLYAAIILLLALWAFRLLRAIVIGLACTNFSPSYLFLYLCTLEVIPFFLLYKLGLQFV